MNRFRWLPVAVLTAASCVTFGSFRSVAATFDSAELNTDNFIAVAAPFGESRHQLLIIEQISDRRPCWRESGNNPVTVEPLLLNFDFTGICGRSTDSNGYSIRMGGEDLGLNYLMRLERRDGELVLVGSHRVDRNAPELVIGRTRGMSDGFMKIFLDPEWRFTRRTYQGKALGHIYLTRDSAAPDLPDVAPLPRPSRPEPVARPTPSAPGRELIFTRPPAQPAPTREEVPPTRPQTLPPPPSVVVPTAPEPSPSEPDTPERAIPVFTVPTR